MHVCKGAVPELAFPKRWQQALEFHEAKSLAVEKFEWLTSHVLVSRSREELPSFV